MPRKRPGVESIKESMKHSEEHRGNTGRYGTIWQDEKLPFPIWDPKTNEEHKLVILRYNAKKSKLRKANPSLNVKFSKKQKEKGQTWDYKLSLYTHSNIGPNKDQVVCLQSFKQDCPICDKRNELIEDEEEKKAEKLNYSRKCIYLVIVLDSKKEMKKGIQIWLAPQASIEEELSKRAKNRTTGKKKLYGVPEAGWMIFFEKTGKGLKTKYEGVEITKRKEGVLSEKIIDKVYDKLEKINIEDFLEIKTEEEIQELVGKTTYDDKKKKKKSRKKKDVDIEEEDVDIEDEEEEDDGWEELEEEEEDLDDDEEEGDDWDD